MSHLTIYRCYILEKLEKIKVIKVIMERRI